MASKNLQYKVNGIPNKEDIEKFDNDNIYYYAVGQCVSFMESRYLSINKTLKKNLITKDILLSKNNDILKRRLMNLFRKCNTMLYTNDKKFNNCLSMILGYIPDNNKIDDNLLQLGFVDNNILQN